MSPMISCLYLLLVNVLLVVSQEDMPPMDHDNIIPPPQLSESEMDKLRERIAQIEAEENFAEPCKVCRLLVDSFQKGMERTADGKFDGGDSTWEVSHLRSYEDSEIRLVEIQEKLCEDLSNLKESCHDLAVDTEEAVEDWWFHHKNKNVDLARHLCINQRKVCCEYGHFGPDCAPCNGGPEGSCSGHGSCNGNGTRSGTGACECKAGYSGESCSKCANGHYQNEDDPATCLPCHPSCSGHCRFKGPKGCEVCKTGYKWDQEEGCLDINECEEGDSPCPSDKFCANNQGSYTCRNCDKACNGCEGEGPHSCKECAKGFEFAHGVCSDIKTVKKDTFSRLITYAALAVATLILLKNNVYIASFLAFVVAIYIALTEYTVFNSSLLIPVQQALEKLMQA